MTLTIVITILATYYITLVLTKYDGPFSIFEWLRAKSPQPFNDILACFVCTAFWVGLAVAFAVDMPTMWSYIITASAGAGGAVLLNKVLPT